MKGKHHIVIEAPRLKYEFTVRRNITLIQGNSATGKTTLIDLLQDLGRNAAPVRIFSDVGCRVFSGEEDGWKRFLEGIHGEIVFIDEGYTFIRTKEFAETVRGSDNYYVLITREALPCLPYSIREIYGIRTSGKYHFPEQIYHEFYQIYPEPEQGQEELVPLTSDAQETNEIIMVEDAKSGYYFLQHCCNGSGECISSGGNTKIYDGLKKIEREKKVVIVADGAAFGAYIGRVLQAARYRRNVILYLPESFEWIILRSGVLAGQALQGASLRGDALSSFSGSGNQSDIDITKIEEVLSNPEEYIESSVYFSWEQFFTAYLERITSRDGLRSYHKKSENTFYLEGKNRERILKVFPEEVQAVVSRLAEKALCERKM